MFKCCGLHLQQGFIGLCFAPRSKRESIFLIYAAEPPQVFTQQSSQSPATALLAFKCGGGMFPSLYPDLEELETLSTVHVWFFLRFDSVSTKKNLLTSQSFEI